MRVRKGNVLVLLMLVLTTLAFLQCLNNRQREDTWRMATACQGKSEGERKSQKNKAPNKLDDKVKSGLSYLCPTSQKKSPKEEEEICGELKPHITLKDDFKDLPPYPSSLQCSLVIISAGAPRCGSTTQDAFIVSALQLMGVEPVVHSYWNYHFGDGVPDSKRRSVQQENAASLNERANQSGTTVLMKSHGYDPRLVSLCQNAVVFTSHRHPFEMVRSLKNIKTPPARRKLLVQDKNVSSLDKTGFSLIVQNHKCWVHSQHHHQYQEGSVLKVLDQAYEDIKKTPKDAFFAIYDILLRTVPAAGVVGNKHHQNSSNWLQSFQNVMNHLTDEKNPEIPGSFRKQSNNTQSVDAGERRRILCRTMDWFHSYNYSFLDLAYQ
ncbi:expressed unknown protein [Seminavis robusta]|uniref:Sulfotransferase n=1 Tax=Seminavis robusta TaxID=568900 RepID=A0A9N8F3M6_9STRA|nr:expressed unknown protein [Seminavis robusta]|eukprot:Sro3169_g344720.1 n/a (379) ;mRNA; f:2283-3419